MPSETIQPISGQEKMLILRAARVLGYITKDPHRKILLYIRNHPGQACQAAHVGETSIQKKLEALKTLNVITGSNKRFSVMEAIGKLLNLDASQIDPFTNQVSLYLLLCTAFHAGVAVPDKMTMQGYEWSGDAWAQYGTTAKDVNGAYYADAKRAGLIISTDRGKLGTIYRAHDAALEIARLITEYIANTDLQVLTE